MGFLSPALASSDGFSAAFHSLSLTGPVPQQISKALRLLLQDHTTARLVTVVAPGSSGPGAALSVATGADAPLAIGFGDRFAKGDFRPEPFIVLRVHLIR